MLLPELPVPMGIGDVDTEAATELRMMRLGRPFQLADLAADINHAHAAATQHWCHR